MWKIFKVNVKSTGMKSLVNWVDSIKASESALICNLNTLLEDQVIFNCEIEIFIRCPKLSLLELP